jgi:hypothetical protein
MLQDTDFIVMMTKGLKYASTVLHVKRLNSTFRFPSFFYCFFENNTHQKVDQLLVFVQLLRLATY